MGSEKNMIYKEWLEYWDTKQDTEMKKYFADFGMLFQYMYWWVASDVDYCKRFKWFMYYVLCIVYV